MTRGYFWNVYNPKGMAPMPRPTLEEVFILLGIVLSWLMFFGVPSAFWIQLY